MIARIEGNPCDSCSVRTMMKYGCCVYEVDPDMGTKLISNGRTTVSVCRNLAVGGIPYCDDYYGRPGVCRSFECTRRLRWLARNRS